MAAARGVEIERLRREIDVTRASVSRTVGALREKVGEAMRWQTYVRDYPVSMLAGALLVGLLAGRRLTRRFETRHTSTRSERIGSPPRLGLGRD